MKLLRPDIKSMNHKKENFDILDPIKKKKTSFAKEHMKGLYDN